MSAEYWLSFAVFATAWIGGAVQMGMLTARAHWAARLVVGLMFCTAAYSFAKFGGLF